ncbi:acetolactate decarboxylase [Muricauda sp. 334s03]|uniref:Alpha-acetolactate decarboxylase n=1 Tax=Flagellimonas yonaguniensis TaxID=3031325 RepID=A0ABT5XXN9_9FLAO|nr:acetolactate decarboxylase [[Muricauda] yonaguniensis]MDF0715617.1 acetolactate decarboxylase [[Muricauda] yonaguniensis]
MKNVMWSGDLDGKIELDSIQNKSGLYGIGPQSFLTGEILINDGVSYLSKVTSDSTMSVERNFQVSAPFFVYTNVTEWKQIKLPQDIKDIKDVENFLSSMTTEQGTPFAFKLVGDISNAIIHIQNLPMGTKVSSPAEAHQGQTNYSLIDEKVEVIGFFSTKHQGVFTHHDSYLHMHLITKDLSKMGHLDEMEIANMTLFLPEGF